MTTRRFRRSLVIIASGICTATVLATTVQAQHGTPGDRMRLQGMIRDFSRHNTDFSTMPSAGLGHYVGNINTTVTSDLRPQFAGNGFKVTSQWRDASLRAIPPHVASITPSTNLVPVMLPPTLGVGAVVDSFDAAAGPYDPSNPGPPPMFIPGSSMPTVSLPIGLGSLTDTVHYTGNTKTTLTNNLHVNHLILENGHTLEVDGVLAILCEEELTIEAGASIELLPCASLTIYVMKDASIRADSLVNVNTADPSRLSIVNLGITNLIIEDESHVYANLVSPLANLSVTDEAHFYGSYVGRSLDVSNDSGFHFSTMPKFVCCDHVSDTAGTRGVTNNGGIVSASHFDTWYRDVPGANLSMPYTVELVCNDDGEYEYLDDSFNPIDAHLFGTEGEAHNYYFTYAIHATFTHVPCAGRFIEFTGADDVWVFVDGELVMDLGGMVPGTTQYLEMDRLDLVGAAGHTLYFFYAQRQASQPTFRLRTNIPLETEQQQFTVSAPVD